MYGNLQGMIQVFIRITFRSIGRQEKRLDFLFVLFQPGRNKLAAELIGCATQRVGDWMRKGVISSVSVGGVRYCSKMEFIAYCASQNMLRKPGAARYRELIMEFLCTHK